MKEQDENKTIGQIIIGMGLFMILVNALHFLLKNSNQYILGIIGFLFVLMGIKVFITKW